MEKIMSKNEVNDDNVQNSSNNLLDQVNAELVKSEREALKAKIRDKAKDRKQHERAIAQIDLEIEKMVRDFDAGVL